MRIREIFFHDFRSFQGQRRISFVDPLTDAVRPMTVIAGTNGTGKTTVLDAIEALLMFLRDSESPNDLVVEAWETGLVCLALELYPEDLNLTPQHELFDSEPAPVLHIAVGRQEMGSGFLMRELPNFFGRFGWEGANQFLFSKADLFDILSKAVLPMRQDEADMHGGLLYFPHDRQLGTHRGGPIEPKPEERQWSFRYSPTDRWQGSLEQLWVWQNYLDLEQGTRKRDNLKPFIATVEEVLGKGRTITIEEGRALVPVFWDGEKAVKVRLDQLPSGEQQCLLLFGELARRRRRGAVIAIDEPEISLHPTMQRLVVHQLRKFAREWDAQVILATHSLEVLRAAHNSERVILDQLETPA
jgi:hypothetical protein